MLDVQLTKDIELVREETVSKSGGLYGAESRRAAALYFAILKEMAIQ
jgi:hypothetical protein